MDVAGATARLHALATSCDGLARALDALATSDFTGRTLLGLVDDTLGAARAHCPAPRVTGTRVVHQLARARLADDRPASALAELTGDGATLHLRRAELLDRLGRVHDALGELAAAAPLDAEALALQRLLAVSEAARAGRARDAAHAIASAPLTEHPALAYRASVDARDLDALAGAAEEPELATAIADRIERERGSAAALAARQKAAALGPERAEPQDALARALAAAGRADDALAAWDRAAALAPAQPSYTLAPIRALVALGQEPRARERAAAIARAARDAEALLVASAASAAAGDRAAAVRLAQAARAQRPGDGRLVFAVGERLAEAGDPPAAADVLAELLVCGAHGRPWHRHEVAGKLVELGPAAATALAAKRACTPADPADLAGYVTGVRDKLPK